MTAPVAIGGVLAATFAISLLGACGPGSTGQLGTSGVTAITVSVPELIAGTFPRDLTCDGADREPDITSGQVPPATLSVVIEMVDHDAPGGNFVHWLYFRDGGNREGRLAQPLNHDGHPGTNSFERRGYGGPCPPPGSTHHYQLTVLALDTPLGVGTGGPGLVDGFRISDLNTVLAGGHVHVLGRADVSAKYGR